MKLSDVIALIGAGYSKAEIDAMESGEAAQPTETPKQETAAEVKEDPKPETKPDTTEALLNAINNLTAIVQKNNVRDSRQPAEVETPKDVMKEADDTLLQLYNS